MLAAGCARCRGDACLTVRNFEVYTRGVQSRKATCGVRGACVLVRVRDASCPGRFRAALTFRHQRLEFRSRTRENQNAARFIPRRRQSYCPYKCLKLNSIRNFRQPQYGNTPFHRGPWLALNRQTGGWGQRWPRNLLFSSSFSARNGIFEHWIALKRSANSDY